MVQDTKMQDGKAGRNDSSAMRDTDRAEVQSAVFVLAVLRQLLKHTAPVGVTSLARELNTTKNRIHRYLRTLVNLGFVVRDPSSEKYSVGPELLLLGRAVETRFDLTNVAGLIMRKLRDRLGHTVVVSKVERGGLRVLSSVRGAHELNISIAPASLFAFHTTAQGKVALAFSPSSLRKRVMGKLARRTPYTIVNPAELERQLSAIKRQGWATAPNEELVGFNALAAPVWDVSGSLTGTVAIIDAVHYIGGRPSNVQIEGIKEAARRISKMLGWPGD
jgi:IclR family transcriptional regulator, KDG regulon repressor